MKVTINQKITQHGDMTYAQMLQQPGVYAFTRLGCDTVRNIRFISSCDQITIVEDGKIYPDKSNGWNHGCNLFYLTNDRIVIE